MFVFVGLWEGPDIVVFTVNEKEKRFVGLTGYVSQINTVKCKF